MSSQARKNRSLTYTIVGLGAASIVGGLTWLYFTKQKEKQNFKLSLNKLLKKFFITKTSQLQVPTKEFNGLIKRFITKIAKQENQNVILKLIPSAIRQKPSYSQKPYCAKPIQQAEKYYQCEDCSTYIDTLKEKDEKIPSDFTFLTQCEECFSVEKHEGHKYQQKVQDGTAGSLICDCGDLFVLKKQGCCESHQGIDQKEIKEDYESLPDSIRVQLIEIFSILFSKALKDTEELISEEGDSFQEKYDHVQVLFTQIFSQINDLISGNFLFARVFAEFFMEKEEDLELYHKCSANENIKFEDLDICECSRLRNLFRLGKYLSMETHSKINDMLQSLIASSVEFKVFFGIQSLKLFPQLFIDIGQDLENGMVQQIATPVPYIKLISYGVCDEKICSQLIDQLGEEILNPLKYYHHILTTTQDYLLALHFELIEQVINIAFEMYRFEENCIKMLKFQENWDILLKISTFIESIVPPNILNIEYFYQYSYQGILIMMIVLLTETAAGDAMSRSFRLLRKVQDQNVTDNIIKKVADEITKNYAVYQQDKKKFREQHCQYINFSGVYSRLPFEISFVKLNTTPNKENISQQWREIFGFKTELELKQFIQQVAEYQNNYLFTNPNGYAVVLDFLLQATVQDPDINTVVKGTLTIQREVQYLNYDCFILSRQLMSLFESETNIIKNNFILPYLNFQQTAIENPRRLDRMTYERNRQSRTILFQILMDKSVFANCYFYKPEEYIECPEERKQVVDTCNAIFKQTIITAVQIQEGSALKQDIKKFSRPFVHDFVEFDKLLEETCDYNEKTERYTLKEQFKGQYYIPNFVRSYIEVIEQLAKVEKSQQNVSYIFGTHLDNEPNVDYLTQLRNTLFSDPEVYEFIHRLSQVSDPDAMFHLQIYQMLKDYYVKGINPTNIERKEFDKIYNLFVGDLESDSSLYQRLKTNPKQMEYYDICTIVKIIEEIHAKFNNQYQDEVQQE